MGYEVRLTAKAHGDLNEIVAYIAQDNPLAAEKLGGELAAEADSLSSYPYRAMFTIRITAKIEILDHRLGTVRFCSLPAGHLGS
jgi:plasmid stabilization system protein ParE